METESKQVPDAPILSNLTENHGSVSITIDKSVNQAIGRLMAVLFGCAVMVGASIVFAIWMIIAYQQTEREVALLREDIRIHSIALGRNGISTDEHATEKDQ